MSQAPDLKIARLKMLKGYLDGPPARGERLIIVGGAPRSGTTMFQSMMDSHPLVHGGPEFDHLRDIVRLRQELTRGLESGRISLFVTQQQIDDAMGQLIESLLLPLAERHGKTHLSEKTPMNVLEFKDLMTILPGARFVHVVRDPRAVFMSMVNVGQRLDAGGYSRPEFISGTEHTVAYITRCVTAGVAACESALDRAITIRYEDLLSRTEYIMTRALRALGLPEDKAVAHPADYPHENEQLLKDGSDPWAGGRTKFTNPEPENLDKWRKGLSDKDIQSLNELFTPHPIFAALGYTFN